MFLLAGEETIEREFKPLMNISDNYPKYVITLDEVEEHFAVIDNDLIWHGGMNLLGKVDIWDNLMRIKNYQVAAELLEIALGITEES